MDRGPVERLERGLVAARWRAEDELVPAIARDNLAGRSRAQDVVDYARAVQAFKDIAHRIAALGPDAQHRDHCSLRDQAHPLDPFPCHPPTESRDALSGFVSELKYEAWGVVHRYELACREEPPDLHAIHCCACMAASIARCAMRMNRVVDPCFIGSRRPTVLGKTV